MNLRTLDQRGYSIVEVIFASLIAGMVVLFLASQATLISSKNMNLGEVASSTDTGSMGIRFSLLVEFADASYHFAHLPIPVGCAAEDKPCVRVLDSGTNEFKEAGGQFINRSNASFVEFYRDDVGEVKNDHKLFAPEGTEILYSSTPALDIAGQKSDVYVTWPLANETSAPFPIVHRVGGATYFGFDGALATSNPKGDHTLLTAYGVDPSAGDLSNLMLGQLVVLYNNSDLKQFSFMKIAAIKRCSATDVFCKELVPAGYAITDNHYAVQMTAISDAEMQGLIPSAAQIGSSAAGNWRGATGSQYFFPTGFTTLYKAGDADLVGDLDIRKWTHFYHANNLRGEILVTPVKLTSYRLVKNLTNDGTYKLVQKTFGQGNENVYVEIDRVTGPIVIARKLGSKTISIFIGE